MKRLQPKRFLLIASLFVVLASIFGCKKEDDDWYLVADYSGETSFDMNGRQDDFLITAGIETNKTDTFSLVMHYYQGTFLRISFNISVIPLKTGRITIKKEERREDNGHTWTYAGLLTILADGDVAGNSYAVLETEDNYIDIESIQGDEVVGKFQVTLVRDTSETKYYTDLHDTLHITNGVFRTNIR